MTKKKQSYEKTYLKQFGPHLALGSADTNGGTTGEEAYKLYSVNKNEDVYCQGLGANGTARIHNDKTLEVDAGILNEDGQMDMIFVCHNGHYQVSAENGTIVLKGKNIILDADESIAIKAGDAVSISCKSFGAKATTCKSSFGSGTWQSNTPLAPGGAGNFFTGNAFKGSRVSKAGLLGK